MYKDEASRTSTIIFDELERALATTAKKSFLSEEFHTAVVGLLLAEKGRAAQQTLIEAWVALEREVEAAELRVFIKNAIEYLRF